jgi:hypothetical protein
MSQRDATISDFDRLLIASLVALEGLDQLI